ncbi:MAG: hydroxymethylglutaryl-CoA lyase, partial [Calditrichaeota bacterium]|nr:hydroxymethylglutaryl-CoA lyase [Calditrichota bacterium]
MKLIECPRDAMQGIPQQIATKTKIDYINQLLKVGFDTIDFGSFVSPKAVPQMADTADVLQGLDLSGPSKLLAIVANMKGAEQAISHQQISYLGYPFSISETFQQRNTNKGIAESQQLVNEIMTLLDMQELVIYISMGFGNPYGDKWSPDIVEKYADQLIEMGVRTISLADTVGIAEGKTIASVFNRLSKSF